MVLLMVGTPCTLAASSTCSYAYRGAPPFDSVSAAHPSCSSLTPSLRHLLSPYRRH
jgi:hypothetical protein